MSATVEKVNLLAAKPEDWARFEADPGIPLQHGNCAYSVDDPAQHDPATATLWTLHLRCGDDLQDVIDTAALIWRTGAEVLIGWWGGDSFHEWCEPFDKESGEACGQPGRALHVQYTARDVENAVQIGVILSEAAGITKAWSATVSTTATHDHQYECWDNDTAAMSA